MSQRMITKLSILNWKLLKRLYCIKIPKNGLYSRIYMWKGEWRSFFVFLPNKFLLNSKCEQIIKPNIYFPFHLSITSSLCLTLTRSLSVPPLSYVTFLSAFLSPCWSCLSCWSLTPSLTRTLSPFLFFITPPFYNFIT